MTNLSGQFNWMSLRGVCERCFKSITWLEYLSKLSRLTSGLTVRGKALFLIHTKELLESIAWQWGRHKPSHLIRKHILVSVFLGISIALSTRRCKLLQKTMTESYLDKNYTKLDKSGGGNEIKKQLFLLPLLDTRMVKADFALSQFTASYTTRAHWMNGDIRHSVFHGKP